MRIQEEKGVMTERTGGLAGWLHRLADRQQQKRDSSPQRIASLCPLFPFSFFCYVLSFLTHPTALFPFFPSHCLSTAHPTFRTWPSTLPPFILSLSLSPFAQAGHSTRLTGGLRHWPLGMSKCLDRCQKKACLCVVVRECACAPCYAMTRSRLRLPLPELNRPPPQLSFLFHPHQPPNTSAPPRSPLAPSFGLLGSISNLRLSSVSLLDSQSYQTTEKHVPVKL
ncbi:MAG: hypothetical protein JOS17DRAFT_140427 [Linnemannia elongata]|nr:MAG: hypothetical protein JOS17DRAFT_140427 [Linnemannia elongata]